MTANSSADTVSVLSQDGNAPGTLQSYSIGSNGVIQGVFSNGQTLNLGQIALATFSNPDGLLRAGDTNFIATANSGMAQVGRRATAAVGTIQAGHPGGLQRRPGQRNDPAHRGRARLPGQRQCHHHLGHPPPGPDQPEAGRLSKPQAAGRRSATPGKPIAAQGGARHGRWPAQGAEQVLAAQGAEQGAVGRGHRCWRHRGGRWHGGAAGGGGVRWGGIAGRNGPLSFGFRLCGGARRASACGRLPLSFRLVPTGSILELCRPMDWPDEQSPTERGT